MKQYDLKPVKDATKDFDKCTYDSITYCYFNGARELESVTTEKLSSLERTDALKFFQILRESLKGSLHKTVFASGFSAEKQEDGEAKSILKSLSGTGVSEGTVLKLCGKVMEAITFENSTNYLLTVARNTIDLKPKTSDRQVIDDASEVSYSYVLVSLCPAHITESGLSYQKESGVFRSRNCDWVAEMPLVSMLYPAPDGDGADMSRVVVFARNKKEDAAEDFILKFCGKEAPVSKDRGFEQLKTVVEAFVDPAERPEAVEVFDTKLQEFKEEHKDDDSEPVITKEVMKELVLASVAPEDLPAEKEIEEKIREVAAVDVPLYAVKSLVKEYRKVSVNVKAEDAAIIKREIIDGEDVLIIPVSAGIKVNNEPVM